jgi:hypothetical protein
LSQRIRRDIQIGESEVESPEKEVLRSFSFSENSPAPASPCLRDVPSPASLVFTPAQHVDYESDLEKLDESALEEGSLDEGALDEGAVVGKSDQEDAVVGKSDQEDVENSHTLSCVNCDAEMIP